MSRSRSRSKKASEKDTATEKAMDPSVREQTTPEPIRTAQRDAYAVTTLVNEVMDLFPEVTYEASSGSFGSGSVNHVVTFDDGETPDLYPLLSLVESDPRVLSVEHDSAEPLVLVEFHASLRTQDSRAPFGLADAYAILSVEDESTLLPDQYDDDEDNDEDREYGDLPTGRLIEMAVADEESRA